MLESGSPKKPPLPRAARREVASDPAAWVRQEPLAAGSHLPIVLTPAMPGIDPAAWARASLPLVLRLLHHHGAVLFRGFDVGDAARFERLVRAVAGEPLAYEERSSPRSAVANHVYTSTEHPPEERIFLHNEQSYNLVFPSRISFCCVTASPEGGATPLADSRRVFARIPAEIRARFIAGGYQYVRNFGEGFGLPWQVAFQTQERTEVEAYCQRHGIAFEWRDRDRLRTRQTRRAAGCHPFTGEPVWFNHATFFHVSTLPRATGDALLAALGEADLPNHTYYGDGSPIEPEVMNILRRAYDDERIEFPWERGDALLLDNMLTAHGRAPFAGPRKVLAAMSSPLPWSAVPEVPAS
ncbi:TauD/TfdA family dioxygenase [Pendulispora albinea]|uniref:TauD/TfdA family dioxygenase n=1 Tax=Pendulispora albinea TaxID=2741071 RepID=A0ABZ2MA56_9BACT